MVDRNTLFSRCKVGFKPQPEVTIYPTRPELNEQVIMGDTVKCFTEVQVDGIQLAFVME